MKKKKKTMRGEQKKNSDKQVCINNIIKINSYNLLLQELHEPFTRWFLFSTWKLSKKIFIYHDTRLYSPVSEIAWNFIKQLKKVPKHFSKKNKQS